MASSPEPQPLAAALSELIALRGFARVRGDAQLQQAWRDVAGERIGKATKVLGLNRGALQIGVGSAPLLSELAAFRRDELLRELQTRFPELKIRDLRFRLRGEMPRP